MAMLQPEPELPLSRLLRTWRTDVAKTRATKVAAALGVGRSTINNWESGLRRPDDEVLSSLDELYAAKGALIDLASALETPSGLPPKATWWGEFATGGLPVWAWCRPSHEVSSLTAHVVWGPLGATINCSCDSNGFVITGPTSVRNCPLHVTLDASGWVDFGRGAIPSELFLPTVSALPLLRLNGDPEGIMARFADRSEEALRSDSRWVLSLWESVSADRALRTALFGAMGDYRGRSVSDITQVASAHQPAGLRFSGAQFRRLREARGLSQAVVAQRTTSLLPHAPVTDAQVALVEAGRVPHVERLGSRLDTVYRADGETFLERVEGQITGRGIAADFPDYWTGPVWLTLHSPISGQIGETKLRWGARQKLLRLRSGTSMSFRRTGSEGTPLLVDLPAGWAATVGMGRYHSAVEINDEWTAIDRPAAERMAKWIYGQYLQLFGATPEGFLNVMRRHAGRPEPCRAPDIGRPGMVSSMPIQPMRPET